MTARRRVDGETLSVVEVAEIDPERWRAWVSVALQRRLASYNPYLVLKYDSS